MADVAQRGLTVLAGAALLALPGCGNLVTTQIVGITGITADAAGSPVVVVAPCGAAYDQAQVVAMIDRQTAGATQQNPVLLEMSSTRPRSEPFTISLTQPGPVWTPTGRLDIEGRPGFHVGVGSSTKDMGATPVRVSAADYANVTDDVVIVREGERWTRADFDRVACHRDAWPTAATSTS